MTQSISQDLLDRIIWIRGLPPIDFWIRREAMIRDFIKTAKLKPTEMSAYQVEEMAAAPVARAEKATLPIRRPPFPGGMRVPHLHFNGDVYLLTQEQWRKFSMEVVKDLNDKLGTAAHLSFDQLRDVAVGIDKLVDAGQVQAGK